MPIPAKTAPRPTRNDHSKTPTSPWLAWTATIFGSLGILLGLAALITTFIVSSHLRSSVDNVFKRFSSLLSTVHESSTEITTTIASSRRNVSDIDLRIDEKIVRLSNKADINPAELNSLTTQLTDLSQRLREWLTLFDSAHQLSQWVEELIDATLIFFRSDNQNRQDILTTLENSRTHLEEAIAAFDELTIQWEKIRNHPDEATPIRPLFTRVDDTLALVEKYTATFTTGIAKLEEASDDLQSRLKRKIFFTTVFIFFLLTWQTVAQFCLARWGWRHRLVPKSQQPHE